MDKQDTTGLSCGGRKKLIYNRCRAVFYEFLKLVIDDCAATNCRFWSPGQKKFALYICEKNELETEIILRKGTYKYVDFLRSDGLIYQFFIYSRWLTQIRYRPVRIAYKRYQQIAEGVNDGKRYMRRGTFQAARETTYLDYVPALMEMFPDMRESLIRKIIIRGCTNILNNMRVERDVNLQSAAHKLKFLVYMYRPYKGKKKNEEGIKEPAQ